MRLTRLADKRIIKDTLNRNSQLLRTFSSDGSGSGIFSDDEKRTVTQKDVKENPELSEILKNLYDFDDKHDLNSFKTKFKEYKRFEPETEAENVILDVEEERQIRQKLRESRGINLSDKSFRLEDRKRKRKTSEFKDIDLSPYESEFMSGFAVETLVDVLRREGAFNILVIEVDTNEVQNYVDYIALATCRSERHVRAAAEFLAKVFKRKMRTSHDGVVLEGKAKGNYDWLAASFGNVALHLFASEETRLKYDLESLWALGPEYDRLFNETKDGGEIVSIDDILADYEPIESKKI